MPETEDFILTDLGRWAENRGRLWHLRHEVDGTYALKRLRAGLDRPHGLALGPDGRVYIGEAHRVVRLPADDLGAEPETVIEGLPADGLHPLTSLVFLPSGDLIVGVGSKSDLCREAFETGQCGEEAGLRRYRPDGAGGFVPDAAPFATGLRNPMGLVYTRGGALYVSVSAHDLADPDQPYDELNLITTGGADFGWPYCESAGDIAEEWAGLLEPHACADGAHFAAPVALLPPHGTPLGLVEWPAGEGLVTTLHGYAPAGHRVMAMSFDALQQGAYKSAAGYLRDTETGVDWGPDSDRADGAAATPFSYLITDWSAVPGVRPLGSPTGITVAADGSLWIVEDRNKTVLRLAKVP